MRKITRYRSIRAFKNRSTLKRINQTSINRFSGTCIGPCSRQAHTVWRRNRITYRSESSRIRGLLRLTSSLQARSARRRASSRRHSPSLKVQQVNSYFRQRTNTRALKKRLRRACFCRPLPKRCKQCTIRGILIRMTARPTVAQKSVNCQSIFQAINTRRLTRHRLISAV